MKKTHKKKPFKNPWMHPDKFSAFKITGLRSMSEDDLLVPPLLGKNKAEEYAKFIEENKIYLTSPDSKLRPILDRVAKWIDNVRGTK